MIGNDPDCSSQQVRHELANFRVITAAMAENKLPRLSLAPLRSDLFFVHLLLLMLLLLFYRIHPAAANSSNFLNGSDAVRKHARRRQMKHPSHLFLIFLRARYKQDWKVLRSCTREATGYLTHVYVYISKTLRARGSALTSGAQSAARESREASQWDATCAGAHLFQTSPRGKRRRRRRQRRRREAAGEEIGG